MSFLDSKVRIFRKLAKKEAQSRASKCERYPTSLKTYWEALEAFYTSKFEKKDGRIAWPDDALRNLLVAMLFIHRSPLRAQNVLSLKLHDTVRLGKRGYEVKLGHGFKTSGSSIHGDTHWTRLPSHISYWMSIYISQVRPSYPGADKTDQLFLTRRLVGSFAIEKETPLSTQILFQRKATAISPFHVQGTGTSLL